jgi:hypothetical protein
MKMCIVGWKSSENPKDKVIFLLENCVRILMKMWMGLYNILSKDLVPIRQIGQVESIQNLLLSVLYNVVQWDNLQHESIFIIINVSSCK